jgi:hypothetical protein
MIVLEARGQQCRGATDNVAQLRFAQRRHVDQAMNFIKRFVFLQFAEEIRTQAHHAAQMPIADGLGQEFAEAAPLTLIGAHVELFALINIEEEPAGY